MCNSRTTKNIDCVKFLSENAQSLCSSNAKLFASTVSCLLDPVYSCLENGGSAQFFDPMPGGSQTSTGERMSLGKSSASHQTETLHCELTGGTMCQQNVSDASQDMMRLPEATKGKNDCPFYNKNHLHSRVGFCGSHLSNDKSQLNVYTLGLETTMFRDNL